MDSEVDTKLDSKMDSSKFQHSKMDSKMDTKMDSGHQNCEMDVDFRDSDLGAMLLIRTLLGVD